MVSCEEKFKESFREYFGKVIEGFQRQETTYFLAVSLHPETIGRGRGGEIIEDY